MNLNDLYETRPFEEGDGGFIEEKIAEETAAVMPPEDGMEIDEIMEKLARDGWEKESFNGAWLYAEKGAIIAKGAVGFCDPQNSQPVKEDTIFQLASVTKQFTAAAVMLLVRDGLIHLEDDITSYFPQIPYKGVTLRHLLTHTSGIPDYFDDEDWLIDLWKKENRVPENDVIPRFLCEAKVKPYFAPGEDFAYSNTGYNLLASVIEQASGETFEDFLKKRLFEPAGMTSTGVYHTRRDGVPFDNYAQATVLEDDGYVRDVDSEDCGDVTAFDGLNGDDYVYTNIFDMFAWENALRDCRVLTFEEQRIMYTPARLNNGEDYRNEDDGSYGFGWGITNDPQLGLIVNHSGGMPGVHTWFERFVDADRMLVILCNREEQDARAHRGVFEGMRDAARGREPQAVQSIEDIAVRNPDTTSWNGFCGKYEHPEDADFIIDEVYRRDDDLYARAIDDDGDELEFRLYPLAENEFGRKGGFLKVKFSEDSLIVGDTTFRKLS
ncbi:MAG: beta-lactamase family protein [Erysipelotrichaceae bacterium]|nr:beta-lactamase family protein [Erysipelotrichaceae bacterium]